MTNFIRLQQATGSSKACLWNLVMRLLFNKQTQSIYMKCAQYERTLQKVTQANQGKPSPFPTRHQISQTDANLFSISE